jgi:hypothetical protein
MSVPGLCSYLSSDPWKGPTYSSHRHVKEDPGRTTTADVARAWPRARRELDGNIRFQSGVLAS